MLKIINNFIDKKGFYVFGSSLISKLCSFLTSIILIRVLSPQDFGVLSYALSSLAFFIPFSGGGMQHSFLRFAPLSKEIEFRNSLFFLSLYRGLLLSLGIFILLYLCIPWLSSRWPNSERYFYVLGFYLFGFFIIDLVKNRFRVENNNKTYASIEASCALIVFVFGGLMAYFFGALAYLFALVSVPIILGLFYLNGRTTSLIQIPDNYISYGLWVGIGAIASQLMYSLDVFLIGRILQDSQQVALYKTASIIPIALFFIPNSYISTHYTDLSLNYSNKIFLQTFTNDYIRIFSIIGLILCCILFLSSEFIIELFFGKFYLDSIPSFKILVFGIMGAFMLRIPFGNILAAVGKSQWNALVSFVMLLLNGFLNYFAITAWGIKGAAIVTSLLFWFSGLISYLLYLYYIKRFTDL